MAALHYNDTGRLLCTFITWPDPTEISVELKSGLRVFESEGSRLDGVGVVVTDVVAGSQDVDGDNLMSDLSLSGLGVARHCSILIGS